MELIDGQSVNNSATHHTQRHAASHRRNIMTAVGGVIYNDCIRANIAISDELNTHSTLPDRQTYIQADSIGYTVLTEDDVFDIFFMLELQSPSQRSTLCSLTSNPSLTLRPRGHQYQLPNCVYKLFKLSFLNHCLFKFV